MGRMLLKKESTLLNRNDFFYYLQSLAGQFPSFYFKLFARRYPFNRMKIEPDSGICIEGFPRSANSYAVVAFRLANPDVKIAHHLHVPAQLLQAVKWNIPAVFLIRAPLEAVSSFMVFQSSQNADLYLKAYIRFYKVLKKVHTSLVVVPFETIVQQFDVLIQKVNRKFGAEFNCLGNQAEKEAEIFARLNQVNDQFFKGQWQKSMYPDEMRKKYKENAKMLVLRSPFHSIAQKYFEFFQNVE